LAIVFLARFYDNFTFVVSSWKDLRREMIRRMMTKTKGKAARMAPVCRPLSPPDQSRIAADRD
jgi:hypothetical protein